MKNNLLDVISPYSSEVLASLPTASSDDVESSLSSAYKLFRSRRPHLPLLRRIGILQTTAKLMADSRIEVAL